MRAVTLVEAALSAEAEGRDGALGGGTTCVGGDARTASTDSGEPCVGTDESGVHQATGRGGPV